MKRFRRITRPGRVYFCDRCASVCTAEDRRRAMQDRVRLQALTGMRGSYLR